MADESITVEVVYATSTTQTVRAVRVPAGTPVAVAIARSGVLEAHPEIDPAAMAVGIHGRVCSGDATLAHGDRIEIYRALKVDPKTLRRRRAATSGRR